MYNQLTFVFYILIFSIFKKLKYSLLKMLC